MKKYIALAIVTALSFPTSVVFAKTDNRVDRVVSVKAGTILSGSQLPTLVLEASEDHLSDFSIELQLQNGEWQLDASGSFGQTGVTYERVTEELLNIHVNVADGTGDDAGTFSAKEEDIRIPLSVKVMEEGPATVTVNGGDSTVSSGSFPFAQVPYDGKTSISVSATETIGDKGEIGNITFSDSTLETVAAGETIVLSLGNHFTFANETEAKGTGKFSGKVSFSLDPSDPSKAVIRILEATSAQSGTVVLSGLEISSSSASSYGIVPLKATYKGNTVTVIAATHPSLPKADQPIVISQVESNTLRPTLSGTAAEGMTISASVDGKELGTYPIPIGETSWSIPYPTSFAALEEGTHTATVSYKNASGKESKTVTQEFQTKLINSNIVFTIGKQTYIEKEEEKSLDAPPFLQNGTTMLPLRALANALSIEDSSITWKEDTQTVTLKRNDGKTVQLKAGDAKLYVDGKEIALQEPAVIRNDRLFLPLRAVFEAFEMTRDSLLWEEQTQSVTILR